jgi:hypothetical protein
MGHYEEFLEEMIGSPHQAAIVADSSYKIHKTVVVDRHFVYDIHEFTIIDNGKSALLTITKVQVEDVSSVTLKHPNGFNVTNKGFREIDLHTGRINFEWFSLDHGVSLNESFNMLELNEPGHSSWDFL